jgi:glycosyltransferase involved in cell wall biosynthesis
MFSVVIPLYNKAHTIKNTLSTVLNQTYKDFEVVIVNDGSTDNGVSVIKNFTDDSRIKIINQKNQGVSVARNVGVENANNQYIAFLDGDDEWLPDYLLKMQEAIQKFPDAGLFCSGGKILSNSSEKIRLAKKYQRLITEINFFENPHVFLHSSATVVAKSMFEKTKGFPVGMKRNEDFALFYSLALQTKVIYIGFNLSIYMGDIEGQATKVSFKEVKHDIIDRFNIVHKAWCDFGKKNKIYRVFTKYELRHLFLGFIKSKDYENNMFFLIHLNRDLLSVFYNWEWVLYTKPIYNKIAIIYIYLTKIRWRLRNYPVPR